MWWKTLCILLLLFSALDVCDDIPLVDVSTLLGCDFDELATESSGKFGNLAVGLWAEKAIRCAAILLAVAFCMMFVDFEREAREVHERLVEDEEQREL